MLRKVWTISMLLLSVQGVIPAFGEPLIVFESKRAHNYDIYLLDLASGEEKRLTDHPAYDGEPSWSPDGQQIVFVSNRDWNQEIYVMDRDGRNQRNLTNSQAKPGGEVWTGIDCEPCWSPDGTRIAFRSIRDGGSEIYVMNSDGTNQRNLTNSPTMDIEPTWSPDGSRIAFTSHRDAGKGIYVMNADGADVRLLSKDPDADRYPAWSPDGRKIAFVSYRCCGGWPSLFVQDIESGRTKRLPVPFNLPQNPAWTPDNSGIIFNDNRPDSQLYIFDLETEETKELVDRRPPGFNCHPDWFDSEFYAVTIEGKLPSTWAAIKAQN